MRNNTDRVGAVGSPSPAAKMTAEQLAEKLSFVSPTEHVELPSRGLFYPPNHPVELKCEIKRDYHVDAIIRILKLINFTVKEDVREDHRMLVVTPPGL